MSALYVCTVRLPRTSALYVYTVVCTVRLLCTSALYVCTCCRWRWTSMGSSWDWHSALPYRT